MTVSKEFLQKLQESTPHIASADVIRKRQTEISSQVRDTEIRMYELETELQTLRLRRAELLMEHDILERFDERNMIRMTTTTTVEISSGRKVSQDRMRFEDALKAIMKDAGRPLQFGDIRNRLESYSFKWNNYYAAHSYITGSGIIESAGMRGMYQLIRI